MMDGKFRIVLKPQREKHKVSRLDYGTYASAYGKLLIASSAEGVCYSTFSETEDKSIAELTTMFPQAKLMLVDECLWHQALVSLASGIDPEYPVPLVLYGTELQQAVWQTLLSISRGGVCSYAELARKAGYPKAIRAVASAIGRNPIVPFLPCHRVLLSTGAIGLYSADGGAERKRALLRSEGYSI